jgi:hypothetical protein
VLVRTSSVVVRTVSAGESVLPSHDGSRPFSFTVNLTFVLLIAVVSTPNPFDPRFVAHSNPPGSRKCAGGCTGEPPRRRDGDPPVGRGDPNLPKRNPRGPPS